MLLSTIFKGKLYSMLSSVSCPMKKEIKLSIFLSTFNLSHISKDEFACIYPNDGFNSI